ncbi:sal-like protein 1 isoform X3 [Pleuronectes platessa]|uniref:sal-like protein 1 isoform X3 n=1 Tax=Pleuronectes platessa TaxID=8262 RepID=UPI00232A1AF2|nr:sal-like protein 1 isoform X3 [Pleuronectes platessa]
MFIVPVNVESKKKANAGNMSQMEELKLFVSERLQAAVSDVCGAFEKTLAGYEEQNSRLKDENNRYRSLLDVVLLSKLPQTKAGHAIKSTPAAASQVASDSSTVRTAERTSSSHVVHVNKSTPSVATILVASDISSAQMAEKTSTALGHVNKSSPSAATILVASDICSAQTAAKTSTAHAGHANKSTPTADASLVASDSTYAQMTEKTSCYSADTQCLFTSHANFFKLAANDNCPLCLKSVQATEKHLMKRHYRFAVHFIEGDTEKFVVPCFCTEKAQGRSHWHCPCCIKIIHRKSNFEAHLSKQHADAIYILQQSQDAVSQAEFQHPELIPKSESQVRGQSLKVENDQDSPVSIIYVDGFIQDMSDINCVQSSQGHPRPLDTQPDSWVGKEWQPAEDGQDTNVGGADAKDGSSCNTEESKSQTVCSRLKALGSKKNVKRPLSILNKKKSSRTSAVRNLTGPHSCKAYTKNTLRTHVRTNKADKIHICEVCGKRLVSKVNLVRHLQSHTKKNQCGICTKQFSNHSSLERHMRLHKPKALNVMSSS